MLRIEALHISNESQTLVNSISFSINRGEVFSLVGESGSGKSLTCLSVLSLLPDALKASGRIYFTDADGNSSDLLSLDKRSLQMYALRKIAYIFQEPLSALNPVQTCGQQLFENITLCGIRSKKEKMARAVSLLNDVGLTDFNSILNAFPFQLSGGQRQRVMIAMAMAGNPELLIADEPTTALDVLLQDEILGLLKKICKEQGRSILLVSHDLDAVKKFSDRIAVMYKGEIVETGLSNTIIEQANHPYTRALLACKPSVNNKGFYLKSLADTMMDEHAVEKPFQSEPEEGEVLVALKQTGKEYSNSGRRQRALKNISFSIRKGGSIGLIGESGSGKSTISKILVKLESESEGEIVYDFGNSKPLTSNIQMVFQDPAAALNPALKVRTMLLEVLDKHSTLGKKEKEKEMLNLLTKVGLDETALQKYPNEFSGGQRQRLCIARALASKPLLLICDEATSALDVSVQAQILNVLKELQISEKLSILMITHNMAVAAWFCTHLIVLKDGEIVEQGLSNELIASPHHPYTRAMVEHI